MQCFSCDQEAVQECPRCGALYCDDHGDALCDRCADPVLALPSYRVFRGSLLALLVGSIVAVWLLVLPPAAADQDGPPSSLQGVVQPGAETPTATPDVEGTPAGGSVPGPDGSTGTTTPAVTPTEEPTPEPTPTPEPEPTTYTVQPGDTLIGIAQQLGVNQDELQSINDITDPASIQPGQVLTVPQ
ncbi:MAG: LysM peptidoglycan-binding domain-containing protein [Dehalococcoidia bacterium]